MERFRPLISQSSNFIDPLTASLAKDDDSVSVGEDPIICLSTAAPTERLSMRQEDHFSATQPTRVLGGGLPYAAEWAQICKCAGTDAMQSLGQSGEMRASRFRSVCWRIYLGVLPGDHTQWLKVIRDERERYEDIRHRLMITPGLGDETLDPLLNNPLSQHEQSPWNQYFEDSELKKLIRQDVVRTFPEVEFFQSLRIRDLMVTVLFCYARQNPDVSYRQGMHEVLAPLIFVLHCDHQAHQHAHEMDPTTNVLQEIMDEAYLEHDAYCLFEGVMKGLEPWYVVSETGSQPDPRSTLLNAQPFARPQDIGPTNLLVQKLTSIHDNLLQRHDSALYSHLARLEIPPQIYGIRWIRLLFGREFSLQDLLMVWDAIFSDCQTTFPLVDFLTIAMLSFIREPLLLGDYTTCLKFLMRYPAAADVQYIIQLALHLRNPKQHPRPPGYSSGASRHMPTVGGRPDIHRGPQTLVPPETTARSSSVPRTQQSKIKKRTTSGEQAPTAVEASTVRRLSSPNAFTDPLNVAFVASQAQSDKSMPLVPTMKELSVVRTKSAPVSGSRKEQVYGSTQSSDESDDDESTDKRVSGDTDTEVMTVEDMSAVCLGCAMKLSHHSASIKTRLAQLQVQPDVSLRTALDGISEVIETLTGVRNQLSGSTGTVYNGQVEECTSQTTSSLTCEPTEHHPLSHPLSVDEQIT
ncbi:TBC1 domain family member 5-like isoform X4 [Penaeus japonicus]|uniref:TBC1 domain family member 5-like isoform X4 n=1 Tax=Penaeus japonicus TaxID=27405 RepID=UPI001C714754|nr:TBC1 domain family member 5-like isoform X4 [Penaeus japonicus]